MLDTSSVDQPERTSPPFDQVLSNRRSIRSYGPLTVTDLVELLESVIALRAFERADDGGIRRFRPIPSAGARQPLAPLVMVNEVSGLQPGLWRYHPDQHQLLLLEGPGARLEPAWKTVTAAGEFEARPPAVVVIAARFDATLARYPAGASLVWRDAGVLLGTLHLRAVSLGLGSCILGTAGVFTAHELARWGITGALVGDVGALSIGGGTGRHGPS